MIQINYNQLRNTIFDVVLWLSCITLFIVSLNQLYSSFLYLGNTSYPSTPTSNIKYTIFTNQSHTFSLGCPDDHPIDDVEYFVFPISEHACNSKKPFFSYPTKKWQRYLDHDAIMACQWKQETLKWECDTKGIDPLYKFHSVEIKCSDKMASSCRFTASVGWSRYAFFECFCGGFFIAFVGTVLSGLILSMMIPLEDHDSYSSRKIKVSHQETIFLLVIGIEVLAWIGGWWSFGNDFTFILGCVLTPLFVFATILFQGLNRNELYV